METKKCKCCGLTKPLTEFSKTKSKGKLYYQSDCNTCRNKKKQLKRMKDPDKEALRQRHKKLKTKYGISLQDYNNMYEDQQGLCKICGTFHEKLVVDHCHETNIVRGLLCTHCNSLLGFAKDNSNILGRAILYLKQTGTDKS